MTRARAGLLLAVSLAAAGARAGSVTAKVVNVPNGHELTISVQRSTETVRLWGVTPPAMFSPFEDQARRFLTDQTLGRAVLLDLRRTSAGASAWLKLADGRVVNRELVRKGLASWNRAELPDDAAMAEAEKRARDENVGIWSVIARRPPTERAPKPAPKPVPDALLEKTKADMAAHENISAAEIQVLAAEKIDWPDGSLGCPKPGLVYAQAVTPGYKIVLRSPWSVYHYHCDSVQNFVLCKIEAAR